MFAIGASDYYWEILKNGPSNITELSTKYRFAICDDDVRLSITCNWMLHYPLS